MSKMVIFASFVIFFTLTRTVKSNVNQGHINASINLDQFVTSLQFNTGVHYYLNHIREVWCHIIMKQDIYKCQWFLHLCKRTIAVGTLYMYVLHLKLSNHNYSLSSLYSANILILDIKRCPNFFIIQYLKIIKE